MPLQILKSDYIRIEIKNDPEFKKKQRELKSDYIRIEMILM